MEYNLLHESWIPVLYHDGVYKEVGIVQAFQDAHRIRGIAASNPMDNVAILRFLLAVLYWCKGNPDDQALRDAANGFPASWFEKLHLYSACFCLLGNGKRFYQYKIPGGKEALLSANYLAQEVSTGTNKWHFRHATDCEDGLCLACCAKGLLRLPVFSASAGQGKPPGINAKPPIYVVPMGGNLASTLRLSWRKPQHIGTPFWEQPGQPLPASGSVPLLSGLTWTPRPRIPHARGGEPNKRPHTIGNFTYSPRTWG